MKMKEKDTEEFDMESMEEEALEMMKLSYITVQNAEFKPTAGGFVSLMLGENFYPRVQVFYAFPLTHSSSYISIREPDEKAKEIGIIRNLDTDVSVETKALLEGQLRLRYFTPQIERIISIKDEYGFAYFDVITNHGQCRFTIHMGGGSVVPLSDTRLMITDLDGNRFEVSDTTKLTVKELKKLDLFL